MPFATANTWVAWMADGGMTTGRMCRRMMRASPSPKTRAASTQSSSRTASTEALR
jgi:hypothetical protein